MTTKLRALVILLSTPIIVFVIVGGFLGKALAHDSSYQNLSIFQDAMSLIVNSYVEEVDLERVVGGALRGLTDTLDADSSYLSPAEVRAMNRHEKPPEGETGIELSKRFYLAVIAARAGSPADRAGIRSGDFIKAIDGKSTRDTSVLQGLGALRGAPGSAIKLTILHGASGESKEVTLVREPAAWPLVTAKTLAGHAGYVRINAFTPTAATQVSQEIAGLVRVGVTELVIDLRGTAAGAPADAIPVAKLFLRDQTITYSEGRSHQRETVRADAQDGLTRLPMAILVNRGTADAAEVLAGALADNGRADLIGEKTFGRAVEQKLVPLPNGGALWLSHVKYFTPSGKPIHEKGLEPTVQVDTSDEVAATGAPARDEALEKALQHLESKLSKAA